MASGATFDTYSSLANIAWIRSKMSPLLNTKEDLKDSNFNMVLLFLSLHQPLIEISNCFNQILNIVVFLQAVVVKESFSLNHPNYVNLV